MAQPTLDAYVDSILFGNDHWGKDELTYYFDNSYDFWTGGAKQAFRAALKSWSDVADLDFREVYNSGSADLVESYLNDADMTAEKGSGTLGVHQIPVNSSHGSTLQGWYNWQSFNWPGANGYSQAGLQPGGIGMSLFIHELGHALGLAHPHDDDYQSEIMPGVSWSGDLGKNKLNQGVFTVMSYNDGWTSGQDPWGSGVNDRGYNSGPGAFDIAAIQYLYGADTSNNVGNTVYSLNGDMGWSAIWDTGGTDKIRYSGSKDAVINLNSAPLDEGKNAGGFLSYVEGGDNYGGYTIAGDFTGALANNNGETGVIIENATGGDGDDTITGNKVANVLKGNGGADDMRGRAGDDKIEGGSGNDQVKAGSGDDTVLGGAGGDILRGESGGDVLEGGGGADTLIGGSGADELRGGKGNDLLKGGAGDDVLRGAGGADNFQFRDGFDADTLEGFVDGVDTLLLNGNLWAGSRTAAQVVADFATDDGTDTVFDFGGGDVLTVLGIGNKNDLTDDISII